MIIPKKLNKGDTIGIVAPSAGLAAIMPHRLDNAIKCLENQGYKVKEFPCARKTNGWESAGAYERANELMGAFSDKEVKMILCEIGGSTSNKLLEYLDFNLIKNNPKIFCWYSDISVLHYALYKKAGLVTYYGPCAMTQFGEYPSILPYTLEYFNKALVSGKIGKVLASNEWTDEVLDWFEKKDLERPRKLVKNKGYEWLRPGKATGNILGGCLSSIIHLLGSEYWPNHKGAILFLETSEGENFEKGKPLESVDAWITDLRNAGVFKEINGLIVGRGFSYDEDQIMKLKELILEGTRGYNFPILYGADIGHTDPQITIPLGSSALIDSKSNRFELFD
jgi:muramoyltetrapeptide carboxypeptidase